MTMRRGKAPVYTVLQFDPDGPRWDATAQARSKAEACRLARESAQNWGGDSQVRKGGRSGKLVCYFNGDDFED